MNKTFAVALLLAASTQARGSRSGSSSILSLLSQDSDFMQFAAGNNKQYTTVADFEKRQKTFHENINMINAHNH